MACVEAMAAQPPRPPPNNLLFSGPPPALPHVLLLPNDDTGVSKENQAQPSDGGQTNDADALHEINNVGLPCYDGTFLDQIGMFDDNQNLQYHLPPESYLRRTHSFDISDIYAADMINEIDPSVFRQRRSEPDLSKYGLFTEVTMECAPLQPPPLVLNNPFYDGSYALDSQQMNQAMVMLPENYLAFEDSFVPTAWDYKPDFLNPEMYCDGIPLIASNDPWSVYSNENAAFQYYSPHYETSLEENGIHYTPLTDLDYAIPQYMSLPVGEQTRIENYINNNNYDVEHVNSNSNEPISSYEIKEESLKSDVPTSNTVVSETLNEEQNISTVDPSVNRDSSTESEESLNADISNDVTSSLAFLPSSKSSQRPGDVDDTSDDTSPCSTDYHEASALDLIQSVDELSCCDSTDYSQSRDEISPIIAEIPKSVNAVVKETQSIQNIPVVSNTAIIANLPLSEISSIPFNDQPQAQIPSVNSSLPNMDTILIPEKESNLNVDQITQCAGSNKKPINVMEPVGAITSENTQCKVNPQLPEPCGRDNDVKVNNKILKPQQPLFPPAVPTSWLSSKPSGPHQTNTVQMPQIHVQNVEGFVTDTQKSPKVVSQANVRTQLPVEEPQPSCSFASAQPVHASQLKPEKLSKEVEVSPHIIIVH